jgi:hypothetical protein
MITGGSTISETSIEGEARNRFFKLLIMEYMQINKYII